MKVQHVAAGAAVVLLVLWCRRQAKQQQEVRAVAFVVPPTTRPTGALAPAVVVPTPAQVQALADAQQGALAAAMHPPHRAEPVVVAERYEVPTRTVTSWETTGIVPPHLQTAGLLA